MAKKLDRVSVNYLDAAGNMRIYTARTNPIGFDGFLRVPADGKDVLYPFHRVLSIVEHYTPEDTEETIAEQFDANTEAG